MYMLCVNPIQQQSSLQQNFSPTCTILLDQKKTLDCGRLVCLYVSAYSQYSHLKQLSTLLCVPPPN